MILFSHLIQVINRFNISFQNQTMESFKTKQEIENIFNYFCLLIILPKKLNTPLEEKLKKNWSLKKVQKEFFYDPKGFLSNLRSIFDGDELIGLDSLEDFEKEDFHKVFLNFIAKILTLLKKYLPYQDPILNNLDFVALVDSPQRPFVQKVILFNETFQIVEQKYVQALSLEAMTLCERIPHCLNLRVKNFFPPLGHYSANRTFQISYSSSFSSSNTSNLVFLY